MLERHRGEESQGKVTTSVESSSASKGKSQPSSGVRRDRAYSLKGRSTSRRAVITQSRSVFTPHHDRRALGTDTNSSFIQVGGLNIVLTLACFGMTQWPPQIQ